MPCCLAKRSGIGGFRLSRLSYPNIRIRVPKGDKAKVQEHAASMGESTNAFVVRAINETMRRDEGHG